METQRRKSDVYAVAVGVALVLLVGAYYIGRTVLSGDIASDGSSSKGSGSGISNEERLAEAIKGASFIDADALTQKIKNGDKVRFVDIRSADDYQFEHIKDSLRLSPAAFDGFSVDQNEIAVIIFSESDPAAFETAKNIFSKKSFPSFFLRGGLTAWKANGNPTVSIGDPRSFIDQSKVYYISPDDLKLLLDVDQESVFLIDVQPSEDFKKLHIKGAMNVPLDELERRIADIKTPIARTVVVYGATDLASFQAGVRISDLGAMAVRTLSGNDNLVPASGLPLDSSK